MRDRRPGRRPRRRTSAAPAPARSASRSTPGTAGRRAAPRRRACGPGSCRRGRGWRSARRSAAGRGGSMTRTSTATHGQRGRDHGDPQRGGRRSARSATTAIVAAAIATPERLGHLPDAHRQAAALRREPADDDAPAGRAGAGGEHADHEEDRPRAGRCRAPWSRRRRGASYLPGRRAARRARRCGRRPGPRRTASPSRRRSAPRRRCRPGPARARGRPAAAGSGRPGR